MTKILGESIVIDYGCTIHVLEPITPPKQYGEQCEK